MSKGGNPPRGLSQSHPRPHLEDALTSYYMSEHTGCVPSDPPASSFLDSRYQPWLELATSIPQLLKTRTLRSSVDNLSLLEFDSEHVEQWRLAYVCLTHLTHAYVRGPAMGTGSDDDNYDVKDTLPPQLAVPLINVAEVLSVQPGLCHAATCLWNWKPTDVSDPTPIPICMFTGSEDEKLFSTITVQTERALGAALRLALLASRLVGRKKSPKLVESSLKQLATATRKSAESMDLMYTHCSPASLLPMWPYRGGFSVEHSHSQNGVFFQFSTEDPDSGVWVKGPGSSTTQSTALAALDILLEVDHSVDPLRAKFITASRVMMPGHHVEFLRNLGVLPSIRSFVSAHGIEHPVTEAYNIALLALQDFRTVQMKAAATFIQKSTVIPTTPTLPTSRSRSGSKSRGNTPLITPLTKCSFTSTPTESSCSAALEDRMRRISISDGSGGGCFSRPGSRRGSEPTRSDSSTASQWTESRGKEVASLLMGLRSDAAHAMIS